LADTHGDLRVGSRAPVYPTREPEKAYSVFEERASADEIRLRPLVPGVVGRALGRSVPCGR